MSRREAATWEPKVVLVDRHNRPSPTPASRGAGVAAEIAEH
jgi:hypothetical protein